MPIKNNQGADNIPKLRFPEFSSSWEMKKLIDFAPLQRGFDLPVDKIIKGDFPVVFSNGILKFHNEYKAKSPGVVTGRSGTIGKVTYVDEDYWPHNTALWVTNFKNNYPKFVYYFYSKYNLERFGTGSGVPTLNRNDVHNQEEFFPILLEQQKIATFLTAVDDKLQGLKKKKSLMEQYKKGVMQKIFSQELRFKDNDGSEYPKWEVKMLGEVCEHLSSGKDKPNENDDYPIYGSMGIIGFSSNFSYERKVILIARVGANAGTINIVEGKFGVTDNTLVLINKIEFDIAFVYYLLIFQNLNKLVFGSGQPLITAGHLKSINLKLPYFTEQIKIANFLSAIDEKINLVSGQVEKMEVWKKGLLQKMFV